MTEQHLKDRTKTYAVRIIRLVNSLPSNRSARVIGDQLLRSGTSVGANYRAVCRAKSIRDFLAKMAIVEEEADESIYWMELLIETGVVKASLLQNLMKEGNELVAITVATIKSVRKKQRQ